MKDEPSVTESRERARERDAFEAWAAKEWPVASPPHSAWIGWQGRAALSAAALSQPKPGEVDDEHLWRFWNGKARELAARAEALQAEVDRLTAERDRSAESARYWVDKHHGLEARLATIEKALKQIAEHPESSSYRGGSYSVGWAFNHVQSIARTLLSGETAS